MDVCLELFPRIQAVFPDEEIALLHGNQEQAYRYTKFVLCTTHQLIRFSNAFDVLVIDEVDAFPFRNNQLLNYGVKQAIKPKASLLYLTATPDASLLKKIKKNELAVSILPARYHRRIVPVPKVKWCFHWKTCIQTGSVPKPLLTVINQLIDKNNLLIFCPSISLIEKLYELLKKVSSTIYGFCPFKRC